MGALPPPTLGTNVFHDVNTTTACLYVPQNSISAYRSASQWESFSCINSIRTVTFNSGGGSAINSQTITHGGKVTKPADPTRPNFVFDGWFLDAAFLNPWNFNTDVVTSDITLFAKWTQGWHIGTPTASDILATLNNGTLTISGRGAMMNYSTSNATGTTNSPWYSVRTSITNVVIDSGVTVIGNYAFRNLRALTSVSIPNSVTAINMGAFQNCTELTAIRIPNSVTSFGTIVFGDCVNLREVNIPTGVTTLSNVFIDCKSLTSITIPAGVTSLSNTFSCCSSLTSVTILRNIPPTNNDGVFSGVNKEICTLFVPRYEDIATYAAADHWKDFQIIRSLEGPPIVPVTGITDLPLSAGFTTLPFNLTGTVVPANATNKTIVWGVELPGTTGASITNGNRLIATSTGDIWLRAIIVDGKGAGVNFDTLFRFTIDNTTSITAREREIFKDSKDTPDANTPINIIAAEFTAGPNPVDRHSGRVSFYWTGKTLSGGTLLVYDAFGNVVNRIVIDGNVGANNYLPLPPAPVQRRQIGSWNLTDTKNRPVSAGTYVVRGTIKTTCGKTERISIIVGVQ